MKEKLEKAIEDLASKSVEALKSDDAMKYAQAASNLAHTVATLAHADTLKKS